MSIKITITANSTEVIGATTPEQAAEMCQLAFEWSQVLRGSEPDASVRFLSEGVELEVSSSFAGSWTGRARNPIKNSEADEAYLAAVGKVARAAEVDDAVTEAARSRVDRALRAATEEIKYATALVRLRGLIDQDLHDAVSSHQASPIRSEVIAYIDATEDERAILRQAWKLRYGLGYIEDED